MQKMQVRFFLAAFAVAKNIERKKSIFLVDFYRLFIDFLMHFFKIGTTYWVVNLMHT